MTLTSQIRHKWLDLTAVPKGLHQRRRFVRILFVVQPHIGNVDTYVRELEFVSFKVRSEVVTTPTLFSARLTSHPYDLVVAECPGPNCDGAHILQLLRRSGKKIPLIFVSNTLEREAVAELITRGAYDCIELDHIGHLPVAVRRALDEGHLRVERDQAEKMLKHSEAKYRALVGNLTYGICRCSLDGVFLDVNQALIAMLGYTSREELLAASVASDVIRDPILRAQLLGHSGLSTATIPLETEWKAKNGMSLKVRLTGREVRAERGAPEATRSSWRMSPNNVNWKTISASRPRTMR